MMIVNTRYGKIQGLKIKDCFIYKGIPYARAPIGNLRFRPPQKPESWEGVFNAIKFSCKCPQDIPGEEVFYHKEFYSDKEFLVENSEDCLYLNIWTPLESEVKKMPVAFWIHGGGFGGGYGSEIEFDGAEYCKKGVILVTINYRVGPLGFLVHPWLENEDENGRAGNYGIMDQIAALEWVYENIEFFGGDKNNITVFGQSAGASSTQILVSSDLTEGMISKAIMQSGGGYNNILQEVNTVERARKNGEHFAELAEVRSLKELRETSVEDILVANRKMMEGVWEKVATGGKHELPFFPYPDNYIFKEVLDTSKKIPFILGTTKNDIYVTQEMLENGERGKLFESCTQWALRKENSYVYYFAHNLPGDSMGAFHSSELWYMFGTFKRNWRKNAIADFILSEDMVSYWTNFFKNGNPNGPGLKEWNSYNDEKKYVKVF